MYYVCVDTKENKISSILNYEPNVPPWVKVFEITDEEHDSIFNRTHVFDIKESKVVPITQEEKNTLEEVKTKIEAKNFLQESDWKVLRHIRQKALEVETTLSEEEYLQLEQARAEAAAKI